MGLLILPLEGLDLNRRMEEMTCASVLTQSFNRI
jgi:hypothetical protein